MSATIMKSIKRAAAAFAIFAGIFGLSAQAETVFSVTQTSYDVRNQPVCSTVRMNPAIYGSLPSDPCALGTTGSYGPDRITKNTYDAASQLTRVDQAFGTAATRIYARYYYYANGTKQYEVDANNNTTEYRYDGFDRLATLYYAMPNIQYATNSADYEQFAYDNNGNKTWWRKRDGRYLYYNYDNLSREILNYPSDASRPNIYTGYDLTGKVVYKRFNSTSDPSGVTYYYDGLGRMSATTDMNGKSIWLGYNQAAAREPTVYPDGIASWHGRDALNRLTSINYNGSTYITQTYNNLGQRTALGRGAGSTSYSYDAVGRLASMTNDINDTPYDITWTFSAYNPASQIVTWGATSNVYDYKETVSTTVNKTFDGLNRDATIAALSGGYDTRGNLTYDGTRAFTYDIENRLLTATGGGANIRLVYDPEGRLAKYSSDGGSTYNTYLYDGVNLIAEYNNTGTMLRRYIHGTGTDEPLVWFEGSGTSDLRYFYQNYQGSVIGYTNASAVIQQLYKYGPYGEPRDAANAENWSGPRFRYTGQTIIPEAKLYYYKARVYDPVFGRFLQTDPVGSKDDLDLYAYVGGDPTNNTDPDGLESATVTFGLTPGGYEYDSPEGKEDVSRVTDGFQNGLAFGLTVAFGPEALFAKMLGWGTRSFAISGRWISVNEHMSAKALAYQVSQGGRAGQAFMVNGVKFDGVSGRALVDAKSSMARMVGKDGKFFPWFKGADKLVEQASRQLKAAGSTPVVWRVQDSKTAGAIAQTLKKAEITGIKIEVSNPIVGCGTTAIC